MVNTNSEVCRSLSAVEGYFVGLHEINFYYGVTSFVRVSQFEPSIDSNLSSKLLETTCRKAIMTLLSRHEVLSVCIAQDGKRMPRFQHIDPQDLTSPFDIQFRRRSKPDDVFRAVEEEVNKKFDLSKLLWRVIVLFDSDSTKEFDVILSAHHSIMDGRSTMILLRDILQSWSTELIHHQTEMVNSLDVNTGTISIPTLPESTASSSPNYQFRIAPPLNRSICSQMKASASLVLSGILDEVLPAFVNKWRQPKCSRGSVHLENEDVARISTNPNLYPAKMMRFQLSTDQLATLKSVCQKYQVTINSALSAAIMLSLASVHPEWAPGKQLNFWTFMAVDVRPFLDTDFPLNEGVGLFSSGFQKEHSVNGNMKLMQLSQQVQSVTSKGKREVLSYIGALELATKFNDYVGLTKKGFLDIRATYPNGKYDSLVVSNLGVVSYFDENEVVLAGLNSASGGKWKVTMGEFNQSISLANSIQLNAVTVNGICQCSLNYREDVYSTEHIKIVVDTMKGMLCSAVE